MNNTSIPFKKCGFCDGRGEHSTIANGSPDAWEATECNVCNGTGKVYDEEMAASFRHFDELRLEAMLERVA